MRVFELLMLCVADGVLGWSSDSHKIVARIAAKHIQPKTRRFIRQHLPAKEGSWMGHSESALVQVSAWADQVLDDPAYAWSKALHFSHTPYRACEAYEEARDCGRGSGRCIVTAIANYTERGANLSLPQEERAEALKFLVHLVADAHSGLHVGFAEDAGGNGIYLLDPDMSLHEVWDSLLLDTLRESLGVGSWVGVSSQLSAMIFGSTEVVADAKLTPEQLAVAGEAIVSETATSVTCASAYTNNGVWISSGDSLGEEYLVSRSGVAIERLIKAGLRLSEVLDAVAASYFWQERLAEAAIRVGLSAPLDSNRFGCLAGGFDPEEFVYEFTSDEPTEGGVEEVADPTEVAHETAPVPAAPTHEPAAVKRMSKKLRSKINKRRIEGIDVESLVLIKRGRKFYITDKKLVESDEWMPASFTIVTAGHSGSDLPVTFFLDSTVFGSVIISRTLQDAIFQHLVGHAAVTAPADSALDPVEVSGASAGAWAETPRFSARMTTLSEEERRRIDKVLALSPVPFAVSPSDAVSDYVRPPLSNKRLREMYGGMLPSDEQRQLDMIKAEADDIVSIVMGDVFLIARGRDLADPSQKRWVFNQFRVIDSSVSLTDMSVLLVDTRLLNEVLTQAASTALGLTVQRPLNQRKGREILKRNLPLLKRLRLLNEYFATSQCPTVLLALMVSFERMSLADRPEDLPFRTLELVMRDEAGLRATKELLHMETVNRILARHHIA